MTEEGTYILYIQERTVAAARNQRTRFRKPHISDRSAFSWERALVPIDWDVGWAPRAGVEVLGNFTVQSEELVFLMKTVCFF